MASVALLALVSAPVVSRTRLFCRYTGLEITDCTEQELPGAIIQLDGCCDHQKTGVLGVVPLAQQQQLAKPLSFSTPSGPQPVAVPQLERRRGLAVPTGPPVLLVTRAFLI
jgi:hypothetical protein